MAPHSALRESLDPAHDRDPREGEGAQIIDLATRNVLPTVSQRKRGDGVGLVAGIVLVAALGGVTLWSMDSVRNAPAAAPQAPSAADGTVAGLDASHAAAAAPPAIAPAAPAPAQLAAPAPQPVLAAPPQAGTAIGTMPRTNPYANPTVIFDAGGMPVPVGGGLPGADAKAGGDDFAARVGGVGGGKATAAASFDPATTVTQGTLIPAVLETAIDTDVPGYVRAIVSTDVRSFDGRKVLIPRSSRLIGQYKSGLSAGQRRAYVIWTRLIRPDGVSVEIGSPAIAFGGETGLSGKVSSHFFERFGSAMLLSVVGGLSTIASGGASVIVGGGQSAAASAVQNGAGVGPTVRVRPGEPVRVFTARDLDFGKVS